jgi:hypothetical protein
MSVDSCVAFFDEAKRSPELRQTFKAITDTRELIALGQRRGFTFDAQEVMAASSMDGDGQPAAGAATEPKPATESRFCHYEFSMNEIPELRGAAEELANLTIKPSTANLDLYGETFREDDLRWTDMSPAATGFAGYYEEVMRSQRGAGADSHEFSRRDFHLVNLDHHVDAPGYEAYFQAKTRMISTLEAFFGQELQFSGSMWYPPFSYRLWHTNETQPGWRMYLIDFDEEIPEPDTASFFRYMNPETKEIVTLQDRRKLMRFFKIEQRKDKLFWHCIVNGAARNRWSFGFAVPESWMNKLPVITP